MIFDYSIACVGLILMSPVILVIWITVRIRLGAPAIFTQQRPGLYGTPFVLYKFRTMTDEKDSQNQLLPDTSRLTPLGKILRSTSLDELPELYNVLKGDMSIVGPRPLLMEYLNHYTEEQARRHDVKPGITGLAQVNGRNALCWETKFNLDVWYVENHTIWLDIKICFLTVRKIIERKGINQPGHDTVEKFTGSAHHDGK